MLMSACQTMADAITTRNVPTQMALSHVEDVPRDSKETGTLVAWLNVAMAFASLVWEKIAFRVIQIAGTQVVSAVAIIIAITPSEKIAQHATRTADCVLLRSVVAHQLVQAMETVERAFVYATELGAALSVTKITQPLMLVSQLEATTAQMEPTLGSTSLLPPKAPKISPSPSLSPVLSKWTIQENRCTRSIWETGTTRHTSCPKTTRWIRWRW